MRAISSTHSAKCGTASEIPIPLLPLGLNLNGEGYIVPASLPFEIAKLNSRLGADPANRFSAGFGSNRSTWLGPPFMNRWTTDFASPGTAELSPSDRTPATQ